VRATPGTLQEGGASFRTTDWSALADCALADEQGGEALAQLCRDYWPPLYSFVRRRGYSQSDAQDLVQGFFAAFLRNKAYAEADRRKGKFRAFLLASLKHYLANAWDKERALKRGGDRVFVLLEEEMQAVESLYGHDSATPILDEEQHYEQCWAAALVSCALTRLGAEFGDGPKEYVFGELKPFLCGGAGLPSQDEVARRLDMPINTLRSHLSRLRVRYGELLRAEVARTIGRGDDLDEELRHLRKILIGSQE
jgi:RNA polymerase sigma factor (sigma-70 family)